MDNSQNGYSSVEKTGKIKKKAFLLTFCNPPFEPQCILPIYYPAIALLARMIDKTNWLLDAFVACNWHLKTFSSVLAKFHSLLMSKSLLYYLSSSEFVNNERIFSTLVTKFLTVLSSFGVQFLKFLSGNKYQMLKVSLSISNFWVVVYNTLV